MKQNFLKKSKFPLVIKADGLVVGKGGTFVKTKKQQIKR